MKDRDSVSVIVNKLSLIKDGLNMSSCTTSSPEFFCFSIDTKINSFFIFQDDLIKVHKFKPTIKWRQSFENYLKTMPPYYIGVNRFSLFNLIYLFDRNRNISKILHKNYCCDLSAVPEESSEDHGSTKPAGWQHGVWPQLQCGLLPEETQSTG